MLSRFVASIFAKNFSSAFASLALLSLVGHASAQTNQYVRFNTEFGSMDVQLFSTTPSLQATVNNFLGYVTAKDYNNTIIHRSVTLAGGGFGIIQGGAFDYNTSFTAVPSHGAITNAFGISNTAGTLAMGLTGNSSNPSGTNPNSATNSWYFNTVDNSAAFDPGLYTVFGTINPSDTASLNVMKALNSIATFDLTNINPAFASVPVTNYVQNSSSLYLQDFVLVKSIVEESQPTTATVTLSAPSQTFAYNGKPHTVTATTSPARLTTITSYNNLTVKNCSLTPATATGTYTVLTDITSPGYSGSATGTIVINPIDATVTTGTATDITSTAAELGVSVNPNTSPTTVYLEYGPSDTNYTGTTTSSGTVTGATVLSGYLPTGTLTPGTLYHYRAVAVNGAGTSMGADKTFTTPATSTSTPLLSAGGAQVSYVVNPNGVAIKAFFIYSTSPTFATYLTTPEQTLAASKTPVTVSAYLSDLDPGQVYYYELITEGAAGEFDSASASFTSLPGYTSSVVAVNTGTVTSTGTLTDINTAPGTGGAVFNALGAAGINNVDGVAFYSTLKPNKSGPAIAAANNAGIWANEGTSTLTLIAQTGTTTVPGVSGATFSLLSSPVYNQSNSVAFEGTIKGGGATSKSQLGIWSPTTGTLALVAREGDPAPGGTTFSAFTAFGLTDSTPTPAKAIVIGTMAVGTGVTSSTNTGIWEGTLESNLALKMRTGDTFGGQTLATLTLGSTQPLVQGQTRNFAAGNGNLGLLATFTSKLTGIVTSIGGTEAIVAKSGDAAPGISGATFSKFDSPIINDNNHVAFEATVANGGVTSANNAGIWSTTTGSLALVAQTGSNVPDGTGTPSGATFLTLSDPIDNNNDVITFSGTYKLNGTAETGLFYTPAGTLTRVVQTGDAAPGCASGVTFSGFKALALPDAGNAQPLGGTGGPIFEATIAGTGVSAANNTGIWAMDNTGALRLIVETGDSINVNPTGGASFKTIKTLTFLPYTALLDGQTRSITKDGDLTYTATFTDGTTGVFAVTAPQL